MSRRWLSAVAGLAASAAMAGTAFAIAPSVQHPTAVRTVTPVLSIPVRDMPRVNLPGVMQRIVGNRNLTQQQLEQLREKLIKAGYLGGGAEQKRTIPLKKLTPVGGQQPVKYADLQTHMRPGPNDFTTGVAFPGLGISDTPADTIACAPPDTNGAVGGGYVVEIVNTCGMSPGVGVFKVWDTAGDVVQGATALGSLWSTSDCQNGGGDNQVSYDQFANRWIMSQFNSAYTGICMAVSQTSDPTGAYYLYNVVIDAGAFTDYPKTGVWVTGDDNSDAYLISANEFPPASCGNCVAYTAAQRSAMLTGSAATIITFVGPPYNTGLDFSALPSDVDGMNMPPLDDPGMFVDYISPWYYGGSTYALEMWQLTPDFGTPGNSTLTGPTEIDVDPFNDGDNSCAPQPSPGECLPVLGDRLMFRLAYRNGTSNTSDQLLVVNHAVTTNGTSAPIGINWYQLDAPAGSTGASDWAINQQGVFAPADGASRFMGSIAMDHMGNIGLGYTISDGTSIDPSIAATGQNYGTGGGVMDAGESVLIAGTGVQEATGRWGDYSSIMVDPSDDCTFWTAQEYMSETGSFHWSTGLGSFKFQNCSIGPTGVVEGNITNASNGDPISGAKVTLSPGGASGSSNDSGHYSVTTAPGTYSAAATAFGFLESDATVTITDGGDTMQDFSLTPASYAMISGKVTDSGHGYPLYAEVKVKYNGTTVADVWTMPITGTYHVNLPVGNSYTITATPYVSGFTPGSAMVTLSGTTVQNFALEVDSSCSAPGYGYVGGINESFEEDTFPPHGWTVTNDYAGSDVDWRNSDGWYDSNYTDGTGEAATADSNNAGFYEGYYGSYDTSLVTPAIDVSGLTGTTLSWDENFNVYSGSEALDVDISTDGGGSWTNIEHYTVTCGALYATPGCEPAPSVDISSYLPGSGSFQLRWRYYNLVSGYDWYAQIDNVTLGNAVCTAIPGSMLAITAQDANTDQYLSGVTVADDDGNSVVTAPVQYLSGAFMFESSGHHTLTASKNNYQDATLGGNVPVGQARHVNFSMKAGQLAVNPTSITVNATVGGLTTVPLHIGNVGTAPVDWQLSSIDAPPVQPGKGGGALRSEVHCNGRLSALSFLHQNKVSCTGGDSDAPGRNSNSAAWTAVADYPAPILDNLVAKDEAGTGLIYSVSGISNGAWTASSYVYDPGSDSWTSIASIPTPLEKPTGAFIDGKLYVANGWTSAGSTSSALQIYDPSTDSWSTGADNPAGLGGGSVAVALNGKMYVIGGCDSGSCGYTTVEVYDPSTDSWSSAADYPHTVSWQACGAIAGEIYCAGGTAGSSEYADTYAYDPGTDSWSGPLAPIPVSSGGLWGSAYTATADGTLLVQDGVTDNFATVTNEGFMYDAGSDSWSDLPNNYVTTYRSGSACGFYEVGGMDASNFYDGIQDAEVLPGYDVCAVGSVPWLSFHPASGTLAAGGVKTSTLAINGAGQTAGTSETVTVKLSGNTPYGNITVPLTVNWTSAPQKH